MKFIKILSFTSLFVLSLMSSAAYAKQYWQADVQVKSVTVAQKSQALTLNAEIFNKNDDAARDTTVNIFLPVGVKLIKASTGCTASDSPDPQKSQGFVTCNLGNMGVRESRSVQVVTTLPPSEISKVFGVFAWSITPDPQPGNNYAEGQAN